MAAHAAAPFRKPSPPRGRGLGEGQLALTLALLLLTPCAHAQDPDAGIDAGIDAGELSDAGVDAGVADVDAGPPTDEQPDLADIALPEGHEPVFELTLSPDHDVMTGDIVTATITVTIPEDDDVAVPRQEFGTLELHDQRHTDHPADDAHRTFVFELDFLMLEPGDQELPPIRLRIVTADGVVGTVHTDARTIHVGSLIANEPDAQPRPPSVPIAVMQDDYTLAYVLGVLGLIALGALIAWLVIRWWNRQPKVAPPPPPPRPAWEVALEKLEALRKRLPASLAENKQTEIVDGVSDALREYLGGRFGFNGLESTTDEVIARVRHERLGPIAVEEIVALLGDADLVKFARAVPDEETCERMAEGAVRIVRGTMSVSTPAITQPARPAGTDGERTSKPGKRKKAPSGADERMLAEAAKAHAAAEAALREDGRREVPDTNPPSAPRVAADPSPQPSPRERGEGADEGTSPREPGEGEATSESTSASPSPSDSTSPWRESKATVADGSRDPHDPEGGS